MRVSTNGGTGRAGGSVPPSGGGAAGAPAALRPELRAVPILIVEDEAMIAWMLESLLEDMGFTAITTVATGNDALAAAARLSPGLIVSDVNLGPSRLDGIAAAATIRGTLPVPVVFVTGHAGADELDRIDRDVPGAPVLRKPVRPDALRQTVIALLERDRRH